MKKLVRVLLACYVTIVALTILYPATVLLLVAISLLSSLVFFNPITTYKWLYDKINLDDLLDYDRYRATFRDALK